MAIRVKARSGESVEGLMRRFKKLCEKEGLTKDVRRKEFYEKPSERARRDARKSIARRLKGDAPGGAPTGPMAAKMGKGGPKGAKGGPSKMGGRKPARD
jgi:small subunit ribosomal protein S21